MKNTLLIAAIMFVASTTTAFSATSIEVEQFDRVSYFSDSAMQRKDYEEAFPLLVESSKLGNKISQFALAMLYIEGLGVEQDYGQAYLWLNVAAEVKEKKWREARDQLHGLFSDEQVVMLTPYVNNYIEKYGASAQDVSCTRRSVTGSNRKTMQCSKQLTEGQ